MYINNTKVTDINQTTIIENKTNHIIYAYDIYVTSKDYDVLNKVLSPFGVNSLPQTVLQIDNKPYGIKFSYPGESPLNPITYIKDTTISKYNINNIPVITGPNSSADWEEGTNIALSDSTAIKLIIYNTDLDLSLLDNLEIIVEESSIKQADLLYNRSTSTDIGITYNSYQ